ncbi:MAG: phosphoglycerate dehydrogenase [Actinomycetaceae bacterium]|nr:phosphoglycerate dehydrogenase [Actinomycetaceae bacterium]
MNVLLLENPHEVADEIFRDASFTVERYAGALSENDLIRALDGVDALGIRSKTQVSGRVFDQCPRLGVIGAFCIGTNQIDLKSAIKRGVAVFNAPYSNTRSVVELAICQIIALSRHLPTKNQLLHRGSWQKTATGAREVRGKTLGIVGYGHIGMQLSVLAEALGMRVVFYDVAERLAVGNAKRVNTLEALLRQSDFVSLHVDGNPKNRNFFDATAIAAMKPGSYLINLSRGFVVDVDALAQALASGHLAGAAVDVFPSEPQQNGETFQSVLAGLDNVILTPHIGGSTEEAQYDIGRFVSQKIVTYERAASSDMSVNLPNLSLPPASEARYRVAYIHQNSPGALARLNRTFADRGANIEGQILGTQGEVGYVITDISSELPIEVISEISDSPETIRLKVLSCPTEEGN